MEIDQEVLCEYCKSGKELSSTTLCEGRWCKETRESYMEDHGITEEITSFLQIKPEDTVYIIDGDELFETTVTGIMLGSSKVEIHYEPSKTIELPPAEIEYSRDDGSYHVFIDKKSAISKYESMLTAKIVKMAKVLASFN